MTFDDFLPRVYAYCTHVPPVTARLHVVDAAKTFCRRSLAWNFQHDVIPTVAGEGAYALTLPDDTKLVRVLACEVEDGAAYTVRNGSLGRKFVRERVGRNVCVVSLPGTVTLDPPPPVGDKNLIVDIAVMPDDTGNAVWPDELEEHVEFIAAGAIGSLCAMPRTDWTDLQTAAVQTDKFTQRIDAVYTKVMQTIVRSDSARTQWF